MGLVGAQLPCRFCEMTSMYCPNATAVVFKDPAITFEEAIQTYRALVPNGVARTVALPPDGIRQVGVGTA